MRTPAWPTPQRTLAPQRLRRQTALGVVAIGVPVVLGACTTPVERSAPPPAAPATSEGGPSARPSASQPDATTAAPTNGTAAAVSACDGRSSPPAELGLDPFYSRYCDVGGIPLVAHADVAPEALAGAAEVLEHLLAARPDAGSAIAASEVRVGVMGRDQVTTQMPEWSDLDEAFPDVDWDSRGRGFGATEARPLVGAGEENLLCLADDPYLGESIWVHEVSHTVLEFGVDAVDVGFRRRLVDAYESAMADGLWRDTYAASNSDEYWAEGAQSYFDANLADDFQHNHVDTRTELAEYDPALFGLLSEVFGPTDWRPSCP